MERHVDVATAVGLGVILLHDLPQTLALLLQGERQHHGVAAEGGGAGARRKVVGHDDAGAGRLRQMNMAVDAAGQHQLAGGVDGLLGLAEALAQRRDPPAIDADITLERVGCGGDRAAADDGVEGHGHLLAFSIHFSQAAVRPSFVQPAVRRDTPGGYDRAAGTKRPLRALMILHDQQ
jgi:hypothetical protein